jgi:hypothetical protein
VPARARGELRRSARGSRRPPPMVRNVRWVHRSEHRTFPRPRRSVLPAKCWPA